MWHPWHLDSCTSLLLYSLVFDTKTGPALIPSANIDSSRTVSLQPGVEGTQTSPAPRPAPHTCCGWRPYLLQHQLEMSVWGAGKPEMHRAHRRTHTHIHSTYTSTWTHTLLCFISSPGFLGVWQGLLSWWELGAMPTVRLTWARISMRTHTYTHNGQTSYKT